MDVPQKYQRRVHLQARSWIFLILCLIEFSPSLMVNAQAKQISPRFEKIFIVVFENANDKEVLRQPTFSQFAEKGVLFTNYHGVTHPSQPNYIALTSGSTHGVRTNKPALLDVQHIGDLLEAKGKSWKTYADQYPGDCFLKKSSGDYVRKHLPFLSFKNVQENPDRCRSRIVNSSELAQDIEEGTLADYSLYVPDLKNSGHDTGLAYADKWFAQKFGPILSDSRFMNGMLMVVTFDEGTLIGNNRIYTAAYGSSLNAGQHIDSWLNHYSLLRLIEEEWDLGNLGAEDVNAPLIENIWIN